MSHCDFLFFSRGSPFPITICLNFLKKCWRSLTTLKTLNAFKVQVIQSRPLRLAVSFLCRSWDIFKRLCSYLLSGYYEKFSRPAWSSGTCDISNAANITISSMFSIITESLLNEISHSSFEKTSLCCLHKSVASVNVLWCARICFNFIFHIGILG